MYIYSLYKLKNIIGIIWSVYESYSAGNDLLINHQISSQLENISRFLVRFITFTVFLAKSIISSLSAFETISDWVRKWMNQSVHSGITRAVIYVHWPVICSSFRSITPPGSFHGSIHRSQAIFRAGMHNDLKFRQIDD